MTRVIQLWSDNYGECFVDLDRVVAVEPEGRRIGPYSFIVFAEGARVCVAGETEKIACKIWPPEVRA